LHQTDSTHDGLSIESHRREEKGKTMKDAFELGVKAALDLLKNFPKVSHKDVIEAAQKVLEVLAKARG